MTTKTASGNILIIGYGKLGSHLFHELKHTRKYSSIAAIKERKLTVNKYNRFVEASGIIFLCVQDSKISAAVKRLQQVDVSLKNKFIFHTSGALTSDELSALAAKGAVTGSFHPVQSFAGKVTAKAGSFKNIYIAAEGKPKALKKMKELARALQAIPFEIKKQNKIYHHICCVMSSNFLAVLNGKISDAGLKRIQINGFKNRTFFNIYMPLALQTLKNVVDSGPVGALTGPIERNDITTVKAHLDALKKSNKDLLTYYILMGIETVKLALKKKSIRKIDANNIYKLFSNYIIKQ